MPEFTFYNPVNDVLITLAGPHCDESQQQDLLFTVFVQEQPMKHGRFVRDKLHFTDLEKAKRHFHAKCDEQLSAALAS